MGQFIYKNGTESVLFKGSAKSVSSDAASSLVCFNKRKVALIFAHIQPFPNVIFGDFAVLTHPVRA